MMPESIQIQTIDFCNRKCVWCPNIKYTKTPDRIMEDAVFTKILSDLKEKDYKGAIHLYLMGEPLMDRDIVKKIRRTRSMFPDNVVFISTNGDKLDRKLAEDIFDAGLTWMGVSIYDDTNAKRLVELNGMRGVAFAGVGQLRQTYYNRAGHVNVACISPKKECSWVYKKAYVNYKGDVILCCSDYDYETVFGNIMDSSFDEIYNSSAYNGYREAHKSGLGKRMPLCEKCNRIN